MLDPIINLFKSPFLDLMCLVESSDWSTKWDGMYLSRNLNEAGLLRSGITTSSRFLKSKIIHFVSVGTFIDDSGIKFSGNKKSKIILTWFHVVQSDPRNKFAKELNEKADLVHTSCQLTKTELIKLGIREDKIVVIPLGIDLEDFRKMSQEEKSDIKKKIGVPEGRFVIGSFQKDGNGWDEGNDPKLIKGPDVFCDVVEKIAKEIDIHVLLTGPARGYVKKRLERAGISYTHRFLDNFLDIVEYYNALDLYLVASRAEGGPKAILESMACGVPVVSTKVGMSPDLIVDGENGMLCEVEDVECLVKKVLMCFSDNELRGKMVEGGSKTVEKFDIKEIVEQHYEQMYKKLFKDLT